MKPFFFLQIFLLTASLLPAPALARVSNNHSGDMFYDRHWLYDRPSVPSDRARGSDMFRKVPLMYNRNADMFGRANKTNTMGRDDMFPHRWIIRVPHHTLTIDPPQGPYNLR